MHFTPSPHLTQNWQLAKPGARGRRGMVVSQAGSAAEAGVAIRYVESIPRTASGKIQKPLLRQWLAHAAGLPKAG